MKNINIYVMEFVWVCKLKSQICSRKASKEQFLVRYIISTDLDDVFQLLHNVVRVYLMSLSIAISLSGTLDQPCQTRQDP